MSGHDTISHHFPSLMTDGRLIIHMAHGWGHRRSPIQRRRRATCIGIGIGIGQAHAHTTISPYLSLTVTDTQELLLLYTTFIIFKRENYGHLLFLASTKGQAPEKNLWSMAQVDAQNQFRRFLPLFSFSFLFVLLYCERRKLLKAAAADSSVQVGAEEDHALRKLCFV